MVRNYKRKSNQHQWTEESMISAIIAVRNENMSINEASDTFGVPVSTLFRRCKKNNGNIRQLATKQLGRFRPTFTKEQETDLKTHILNMEKRLFGLTIADLRTLAYQYAEKNRISHGFSHVEKMAGRDWVDGFLKRNKEISIRVPENTSSARASAFNRINVGKFFELLGDLMERYNFPASAIYNCDETGITTVPNKPSKIVARKGKKQIGTLSSAERGTTITSLICCNALGQYIPPLIIFPRVRKNPLLEIGLPAETKVVYHPSGWMQSEIFAPTWINHFIHYAKPSPEQPTLLILDGHATHVRNLQLLEIARENNIHILVLPPHTSHRLQPLDVSFMYPLSTFYEQSAKTWLRNHPGRVITVAEVGGLFGLAYIRAATTQNAISGFKNTGIYPMNPDIFPEELFEPSETTNRDNINDFNVNANNEQEGNNHHDETEIMPVTVEDEAEIMPDDGENITPSILNLAPVTISPVPGPSKVGILQETPEKLYYSPAELLPIPQISQVRKVKRKGGKTTIITASPYLQELKLQQSAKKSCTFKKKTQVKRKICDASPSKPAAKTKRPTKDCSDDSDESSSFDEKQLCKDSSSDLSEFSDNSEDALIQETETFTISQEHLHENDFVLVELKDTKRNNSKDFVGQILKIAKSEDEPLLVKFMRNYRIHKNIFIFPNVDDTSEVFKSEIKGKLTVFKHLRYGKIQFQ